DRARGGDEAGQAGLAAVAGQRVVCGGALRSVGFDRGLDLVPNVEPVALLDVVVVDARHLDERERIHRLAGDLLGGLHRSSHHPFTSSAATSKPASSRVATMLSMPPWSYSFWFFMSRKSRSMTVIPSPSNVSPLRMIATAGWRCARSASI